MQRRDFVKFLGVGGLLAAGGRAMAATESGQARIAAAWRGPNSTDTYHAGVLVADWERHQLRIEFSVPLPTRPHGLTPETDGSLLVVGVRPGGWLMRIDPLGQVARQMQLGAEANVLLNGHVVASRDGELLFSSETDFLSGVGRIGVRRRQTLEKVDEWASGGKEPHQLLLDPDGNLVVANGGIPRTRSDKKYDLPRMDSSLARIDTASGQLTRLWTLEDRRLSLRHLAWSQSADGRRRLGVAMQAEHDSAEQRRAAPMLALLEEQNLIIPGQAADGLGYAGDIAPADGGGFVLTNNQQGAALLWRPGMPEKMTPVVELPEAYAITEWFGPKAQRGVLVSTALGLVRWHPTAKPAFLPWPKPMALDNHWVLLEKA